jgi:diguanylate cyclase (GGDEF)-like protein
MAKETLKVLMVEDSDTDARLLHEIIAETVGSGVELYRANSFWDARLALDNGTYEVMLLDLGLPDVEGTELVLRLQADAPSVPIVILTGRRSEQSAKETVEAGAHDYLLKGEISGAALVRSLGNAVHRHKVRHAMWMMNDGLMRRNQRLYRLSHFDALTKVMNRRGFKKVLTHAVELAGASQGTLTAILVDVDNFKQFNSRFSHAAGDLVLRAVARALKNAALGEGHVARVGGDEFLVLLKKGGPAEAEALMENCKSALAGRTLSWTGQALPSVSISAGVVESPSHDCSLASLLRRAHEPLGTRKKAAEVG